MRCLLEARGGVEVLESGENLFYFLSLIRSKVKRVNENISPSPYVARIVYESCSVRVNWLRVVKLLEPIIDCSITAHQFDKKYKIDHKKNLQVDFFL